MFSKENYRGLTVVRLWVYQPTAECPSFLDRIAYYVSFSIVASLWLAFKIRKYHIVLTTVPPLSTVLPGLMAKIFKRNWIIDIQDLWLEAAAKLNFIDSRSVLFMVCKRIELLSYRKCDILSTVTKTIMAHLSDMFPCHIEDKCVVLPHRISNNMKLFDNRNRRKKNRIVYTGSLGTAQALDKVIIAMKKIIQKHDVELSLVGKGELESSLKTLVEKLELHDYVKFEGYVPRNDIPEFLSQSILGLAPLKENRGLEYAAPTKVFEYMACGLPFVACGKGEIEKLARTSQAGVVTNNDPDEIAKTIICLLDKPKQLQKMAENGIRYLEENFAESKAYDRFRQKLFELMN